MRIHPAPWSRSLVVTTLLVALFCLTPAVLAVSGLMKIPSIPFSPFWFSLLPMLVLAGCAPFWIRGYETTPDAIRIHRLFGAKVIALAGLQSSEFDPQAMRGSIRLCGISGLFSFTGFFWNPSLRTYRAYVSDPSRTVVLKFTDHTVLLSPADPGDFMSDLAREPAAGEKLNHSLS